MSTWVGGSPDNDKPHIDNPLHRASATLAKTTRQSGDNRTYIAVIYAYAVSLLVHSSSMFQSPV
jgi:hypothetical protein